MAKRKATRTRGLRVSKRKGSPFWQVTGSLRGRKVRESTGTISRSAAEDVMRSIEAQILEESIVGKKRDCIFSDAYEHYMAVDPHRDTRFHTPIVEHFGKMPVSQIDDSAVLAFRSKVYPSASVDTVNRQVYTPIISVLRVAAKAKLCGPHSLSRLKTKKRIAIFASPEWVDAFLDGAKNRKLRAIVLLLTTTGCRVSEACRLTWAGVNFVRGEAILGKTKNGMPRRVLLSDAMMAALREVRSDDDPEGKRCFGYAARWSVTTALRRECERLKVPYFSTHKLGRHCCAARLLARGNTLADVAAQVGWAKASLKMLYETYGHLEQSKLDENMRAVANEVGSWTRSGALKDADWSKAS